ncbi:type I-E CRISPR-associated protein Cas7/Cse4/CasC [Limosilactobacillus fastidiosus]|uniref:Type I-E CRISPR-associated protein Cas7/Cse4/CasC n=1 Tax=Limosilactobacillus fastidiosus TaxID=2759855 RepID=A0ABR6E6X5_9LACO|nr:type I-E CRISPR-associated protein Cas7/Cse4/CasC [Limosilactobacillus fastidiosus]MBB1062862.1 type I-E CRISPR-associated protein Cas7/Cse4/CasC [Limosilactobacillus fastidiosus]MCD7084086.1 type I-E CRISPR-associated protein Cas7/Cse4/CasC [Limosilactobacillus fastidiosus]
MNSKNLYVDINILQSVPSSNINRDDTGAPKTAIYGGVTRSRVSSQSWKRAIRMEFNKQSENAEWLEGIRTTRVPLLLAKALQNQNSDLSEEDALDIAVKVLSKAKIKLDKKTNRTKALLMVSKGQIEKLAKYALSNDELDSKAIKTVLQGDHSLDMALFGRMVADDPSLNVDASCQVAHAISTHEIVPEFDYYTAVDDAKENDESGSAMIGTIEYDSATLYRYANVNVNELIRNLGNSEIAIKGLQLFIQDFVMSMPTGKQNSFANRTVPQYVMVTIREDTPVNLVSAFEEPVKSRNGYIQISVDNLESEYQKTQKFVDAPLATYVLTNCGSKLNNQVENINDMLKKISQTIETRVDDENTND